MLNNFIFVAGTVVNGAATTSSASGATKSGMNPMLMIIVYCIVIFGVLYIFSIRPQKRKEKELQNVRNTIKAGDSVLLANGLYGKVVDVTAECYIVEFGINKGVRVPVLKQEVYAKKEPNLTNKAEEEPVPEKKGLFSLSKKTDTNDITETKEDTKTDK
ncbi:MAG: preprotein translocase subunit YajC [Clostridia bacterium]|jgi:preprotein translocase subunit YajC|nr:preprotein translocase subunit YajC [Clostridia bacterium]